MSRDLNPAKALIFRIIHRNNVPWVLDNGLHCRNSTTVDPYYVGIGNPELIDKRSHRTVPCHPGGTLSDYVPFYFTPFSPMLYNIKTGYGGIRKRGNDEIVILASSLHTLSEKNVPFLFTDRHAYLALAQFYSDVAKLIQIDWSILQRRDFKRDENDLGKFERYQAEALVFKHLPIDALIGIACYDDCVASSLKTHLAKRGLTLAVATKPTWYF
jgi:hypothetical protein